LEIRDGLCILNGEQATGIEPGDASEGSAMGSHDLDQGSSARARAAPGPPLRGEPQPWRPPPELLLLLLPAAPPVLPARLRPLPLPST